MPLRDIQLDFYSWNRQVINHILDLLSIHRLLKEFRLDTSSMTLPIEFLQIYSTSFGVPNRMYLFCPLL